MSRPSVYDNASFLLRIKAEFAGLYPRAALRLIQPLHPDHLPALSLWWGFKAGVKFAVDEGLTGEEH